VLVYLFHDFSYGAKNGGKQIKKINHNYNHQDTKSNLKKNCDLVSWWQPTLGNKSCSKNFEQKVIFEKYYRPFRQIMLKPSNVKKLFILVFLLSHFLSNAQIRLPKLISDGMILQRETQLNIWGWASPNEAIKLFFDKKTFQTKADEKGNWTIKLPSHAQGGPFELIFEAKNVIKVQDIWFGDVWLCSGQSNMELMMERVKDKYPTVITNANNPNIRQFTVPDIYDFNEQRTDLVSGNWVSVNSKTINSFSAVAYFFANELYKKYQIPIGIINAALGGSPIQAWISEKSLKQFPLNYEEGLRFRDKNLITQIETNNRKINTEWYGSLNNSDEGLKQNWHKTALNDDDWKEMQIPNYWSDIDTTIKTGSVWFRKSFDLSNSQATQSARLFLGRIVDADSVFINDKFIGTTSYQYPPRKYSIPNGILKEKGNVISVRVINSSGKGGFVTDKPYQIIFPADTVSLKGSWKYKIGTQVQAITEQITIRWKPMGLYNAMISPLTNFTIKGALWYQGESNTDHPNDYAKLLPTLIHDWRNEWKQGDFPFLCVQLANYLEKKAEPSESNWAIVRQAQLASLSEPNTGLAVITDLGEWNDIHPHNKEDVGKRLALLARKIAYHEKKLTASGPIIQAATLKDNKITLNFTEIDGGLIIKNSQELAHFAVAGEDKKFVWAKAKIVGKKIIISNIEVKTPKYIRYGWADNPENANLYNKAMLPASPFEITVLKR
jgi:sialate O-acetylesterase